MLIIKKDLLSVRKGVIGHQVNCLGVMGAGVALAIRKKYPVVFAEYTDYVKSGRKNILGTVQSVQATPELVCLNIFGQGGVGLGVQTSYVALQQAADYIQCQQELGSLTDQLFLPYGMGCGLGGGDWQIVQNIFDQVRGYWCLHSK